MQVNHKLFASEIVFAIFLSSSRGHWS